MMTSLLMCARAAVIHRDIRASIRTRRRLLHRQLLAGEQELELHERELRSLSNSYLTSHRKRLAIVRKTIRSATSVEDLVLQVNPLQQVLI